MSASCEATCSACGHRQLWLSNTFSLQLDDGSLTVLPHPGEDWACERHGLTFAQASQRGRLYRETFYVCHTCGRSGEFIEQWPPCPEEPGYAFTSTGAAKVSLVVLAGPLPVALWFHWWEAACWVGLIAVVPWAVWWKDRRNNATVLPRNLPRPDAPGRVPVGPPTRGCFPGIVMGQKLEGWHDGPIATGPCCERPNWKWASRQRDEDRIPCCACGRGVMTVSESMLH